MYCNCNYLFSAKIFPEHQKLVKFRVIKARHFFVRLPSVSTTDNLVPSGERPHSSAQEFFVFKQPIKKIWINSKILCLKSPSILVPRLRRLGDEKRAMGTRMGTSCERSWTSDTPFSYPDPDHSFLEIVFKFKETNSVTMLTDRCGSRTFQRENSISNREWEKQYNMSLSPLIPIRFTGSLSFVSCQAFLI